jgi:DNA-binding transcriptional LysR family regulator
MLDVRRLRVLREVVDAGSVTAAAHRLAYAPSAVSQQIAALERETGVALLERAGRGIRPTAAGLLLAEHAREVIARLHEAEAALAALREGHTGRVALAAFPTAGAGLVPTAVREYKRHAPHVAVNVTIAEETDARDALRDGRVDIALVVDEALPDDGETDAYVRVPLLEDPFRLVLNRRHPLAARRTIALAEMAGDLWVTASSWSTLCEKQTRDACLAAGFEPKPAVEADDYTAAQAYVAAGMGVALVPAMALGAVHDGVVVRRIRGDEPVRHVVALTRPALARDGAVPGMLSALRVAADEQRTLARSAAAPLSRSA